MNQLTLLGIGHYVVFALFIVAILAVAIMNQAITPFMWVVISALVLMSSVLGGAWIYFYINECAKASNYYFGEAFIFHVLIFIVTIFIYVKTYKFWLN